MEELFACGLGSFNLVLLAMKDSKKEKEWPWYNQDYQRVALAMVITGFVYLVTLGGLSQ